MKTLDFDPAHVQSAKDIADINSGAKCAVSEAERIENLLVQARQFQTDVTPSQYSPLKRACVYIDVQRTELAELNEILVCHVRARTAQAEMITKLHGENWQYRAEIARLTAPLWRQVLNTVRSWAS